MSSTELRAIFAVFAIMITKALARHTPRVMARMVGLPPFEELAGACTAGLRAATASCRSALPAVHMFPCKR